MNLKYAVGSFNKKEDFTNYMNRLEKRANILLVEAANKLSREFGMVGTREALEVFSRALVQANIKPWFE